MNGFTVTNPEGEIILFFLSCLLITLILFKKAVQDGNMEAKQLRSRFGNTSSSQKTRRIPSESVSMLPGKSENKGINEK